MRMRSVSLKKASRGDSHRLTRQLTNLFSRFNSGADERIENWWSDRTSAEEENEESCRGER